VLRSLDFFGQNTIDYVDCLLAGYADAEKEEIFTFDSKLQKFVTENSAG